MPRPWPRGLCEDQESMTYTCVAQDDPECSKQVRELRRRASYVGSYFLALTPRPTAQDASRLVFISSGYTHTRFDRVESDTAGSRCERQGNRLDPRCLSTGEIQDRVYNGGSESFESEMWIWLGCQPW